MRMKNRKGFFLIELIFAIIIVALIMGALYQKQKAVKTKREVTNQVVFFKKIEEAINSTFISILDALEPASAQIASDASNNWGWRRLILSSPLPTFAPTTRKLTYSIQFSLLSAAEALSLRQEIEGSFRGICTFSAITPGSLVLDCDRLVTLTTINPHTVGTEINAELPPIVTVTYDKNLDHRVVPPPPQPTASFDLGEVFKYRRAYSENKMNTMKTAIRRYYNQRAVAEYENQPTAGLNSATDESIPWMWQMFADTNLKRNSTCTVNAGTGVCGNFNSTVWKTTVGQKGWYMRKLISNIMLGDLKYAVDGFNNQIIFVPFVSQCAPADLFSCTPTAPPVPSRTYGTIGLKPPHNSALYVRGNGVKATYEPSYTRQYIVY